MKKSYLMIAAATLSMSLASCSSIGAGDDEYVSVQLEDSKMWSLMEVKNGNIVMSDEFFAPSSRVVKGSFFVENDNGDFDLYNLKDTKNKLNRSSYTIVTNFNSSGYAITRVKEEPWQIIDTEGNTVATLDKNLNVLSGFTDDGLAQISNKDNMFGYVNVQGEEVIKPRYIYGTIFSDGVAIVVSKLDENSSPTANAINTKGETLFTFSQAKYSDVSLFHDGYMFAVEGDHSVLVDKNGKKIMSVCSGTQINNLSYHKGKIIYYDGQFYGVKNLEDKILIRAKYQRLKFQSDGNLIAVNSNGKYGVITSDDEIVTPFDYDVLEYLAPGRYITTTGNVKVMIDSKGKEIGDKAYSNVLNRSASASETSLTSLITSRNNNVTETNYSDALDALQDFTFDLSDIPLYEVEESIEMGAGNQELRGKVDGKYDVVVEFHGYVGDNLTGYVYYPSTIKKYGRNKDTLMPFNGYATPDGYELIVENPQDKSHVEYWNLTYYSKGLIGHVTSTTGKEFDVDLQ